jgi:hypothetical protein
LLVGVTITWLASLIRLADVELSKLTVFEIVVNTNVVTAQTVLPGGVSLTTASKAARASAIIAKKKGLGASR